MSDLFKKDCVACDGNTLPFDTSEIHKFLKKVDGWDVKSDEKKNFYHHYFLHPSHQFFLDIYEFQQYQMVGYSHHMQHIFFYINQTCLKLNFI